MLPRCLLLCASVLLLLPRPARADDREAAAHRRLAVEHVKAKRYADAAAELEKEYALTKQPIVLYKIAECHRALGGEHNDGAALGEALRYYEKYLARESKGREAERSREAMKRIETELARRVPVPTTTPPPPAGAKPAPPLEVTPPKPVPIAVPLPAPPADGGVETAPLYKRWWVWAVAGAVVTGTVTAVVLGTRGGGVSLPAHDFSQMGPY